MKKYAFALITLCLLQNIFAANVFEGTASVGKDGDFPEGYYMSAKGLQKNTLANVTNLETGVSIRVNVSSSLDTGGLLAVLSKESATALGIIGTGRIRVDVLPDTEAFSPFLGTNSGVVPFVQTSPASSPSLSPPPETVPALPLIPLSQAPATQPATGTQAPLTLPSNQTLPAPAPQAPLPPASPSPSASSLIPASPPSSYTPPSSSAPVSPASPASPLVPFNPSTPGRASLVPAPAKPPENGNTIPDLGVPLVAPISPAPAQSARPASQASPSPASAASGSTGFSVPTITNLEKGKYYLQVGAFKYPASIEPELDRIGKNYPLVVELGGSSDSRLYKVLLGPVSEGEAGALFQEFRGKGYSDVFIRKP
ncbi:MAG: SPOR domain-containing protein [Spirochaetaceae bacterium]|jgi:hypothetical protein|nr:SPOR domain-containing protein [Spirochaetaceae bacterium]